MLTSRISNTPISPQRINPQFIGIAQKYSQHKKYRVKSDKKRQDIYSNYQYMLNLDKQLDKGLQQKNKELERLKKIRKRHNNDIKQKLEEEEKKRRQLQQLRKRSSQTRQKLRNGIRNSHNNVMNQKIQNKNLIKEKLYQLQLEKKQKNKQHTLNNYSKHKSVELGKQIGSQRINQYYLHKNQQSIDNYASLIKAQDQKSQKNLKKIKNMTEAIDQRKKIVDKKQNKLKNVMDQISFYSIQSSQERRANMLATGDLFRTLNTSSSQRSKPGQILMNFNLKNN